METFNCVPNVTKSKLRPHLTGNFYHNVSRGMRPIGSEYAVPSCTGRRSTSSLTLTYPWQERPPPTPVSCVGVEYKSSKGKLCSIALAVASFVVLVAVLAIAGLALYMGVLHTETPNALLTFSCSAKILKGDRFIGALQEKARRYKRNFEAMYQRSILGQAFISCIIDKFGNDTVTIYFKLAFNRMKLSKNVSNIEKAIKDILITDAISRHPVFKNIRFDARHITVRQVLSNDVVQHINPSSSLIIPSDHSTIAISSKNNGILKSFNKTSPALTIPAKKPAATEELEQIKDEDLPVVQGSFKISKTDADITEKKTELSTIKPKPTQPSIKKTTFKESSVTSALYKIAAVEKVTKKTNSINEEFDNTTPKSSTTSTTTVKPSTAATEQSTKTVFLLNPFDEAPWIPILPNMSPIGDQPPYKTALNNPYYLNPTVPTITAEHPVYTSFTNPGLSLNFNDAERLGSTSLKSHPIPVNKIFFTESVTDSIKDYSTPGNIVPLTETTTQAFKEIKLSELLEYPVQVNKVPSTTEINKVSKDDITEPVTTSKADSLEFVEIETFKYVPTKKEEESPEKREQLLRNISSIFHTLASSLDTSNLNITLVESSSSKPKEDEIVSGQGQVEVVVEDVDDLVQHTTKHSLVTLLPVKSNSGIGRPIRKRPFNSDEANMSVENRSFPTNTAKKETKNINEDFKIMGILNFATEESVDNSYSDLLRYPKMDFELSLEEPSNASDLVMYLSNSSDSVERDNSNILTADEIKQLAEISKITDNSTSFDVEPVISNKAISSSYTNLNGLPILTKPHNKMNILANDAPLKGNISDCTNTSVICGDGSCLPETTKCNQLIDCSDGTDEENCNCADYLKSQYLLGKICDGVVDCWDYSDENRCDWCQPEQYVCSNSKVCIDKHKICDGFKDCPQGDDERQCVTISSNIESADKFPYFAEGFLMVRKYGKWGKLCIDNFESVVNLTHIAWQIPDLGKAVCKSMTYQSMSSIRTVTESKNNNSGYFELTFSFQNETKSSLSFKNSNCTDKKIVMVECQSLECGARPQVVKHIARVVGGGNAGLGAWPWQAALYKEGEFQCGATLLSDRWLVSAGHCFYHAQDEYWIARLGALRRGTSLPSPYEQLQPVVKIIVHPGYVDSGFINDISLLKLKAPVIFSDYVRPVCLPQPNQVPADGRLCTVIGWGQLFEVGRIFPDTLQEVQVPIITTSECRKRTLFLSLYHITEDMFCAGYERGGRDACLGDSGGPLMCPESNGRWTLQGITSNGYGCARANRPGVYTKVANYVEWIKFIINNDQLNAQNEISKNSCTGHRCPLGECLPESRLCNGFIECSDGSDEKNCTNQKSERF
ncbi:unnamed protein product [Psylliodes chrysocephalus]|uniref:Peptidase S1 domain-containing protein n=1 Tax=Psylliodes chrysocephalus TaxID=3402493 RepID=A0A9P0CP89_9CUCU|nr:unnamed protein product [Psylliodes chrysocephala]